MGILKALYRRSRQRGKKGEGGEGGKRDGEKKREKKKVYGSQGKVKSMVATNGDGKGAMTME